ncbi:hypothetical protein FIG10_23485 [Salmonella enterica]|uniref:Uncharacterized protein n=3 Tax=Salmonella enterica TaxID=28901 RepID=A0A3L2LIY3_SALER|nr:hypothetical protein [Salmonella enterica subsp. enterica]EAA9523941.1 hypothetical protein [Salmonella enterica]EAU5129569.1 hypothetical protein [Salmonella enterica subsp. enterica serovar Oranienburg]EBI0039237.1 hypothetical protein [Salmonella enterica subsp. diarizonae serovar 61:k:z35]ECC8717392.1 hypothetical protein [Salmonella enterica subsp. houtenae]ECG1389063.1 hypothetical protein [Salmonella enterica subsp. houtenae str. CFSAN000557]ECT3981049.1 hypothetical protein [Salmon
MDNELEEILSKAGMKKKDSVILIKLAEKKNISLGRAFFLYACSSCFTLLYAVCHKFDLEC